MSVTTLSNARSDLFALLGTVANVEALNYEPRAVNSRLPVVTVFCDGYTPTQWRFTIRVYSAAADDQTAQLQLDTICPAVEDALDSNWGPIDWSIAYSEQLDVLVASLPITAVRGDL